MSINLLPPQIKEKEIQRKINIRVFKLFLIFVFILVFLNLLIWLTNNIIEVRLNLSKTKIQNLEKQIAQYKDIEGKALFIKDRLNKGREIEKERIAYSTVLKSLANLTPSNVKIETVNISNKDINVSAQAASEEEVVKFQRSLERDELFSNVYIQSSTLAGGEQGGSIKFALKANIK